MWDFKEIKQAFQKYHDGLVFLIAMVQYILNFGTGLANGTVTKTSPINCPGSTHSINRCFFHVISFLILLLFFP